MSAPASIAGSDVAPRLGYRVDELASLTGWPTSTLYSAIRRGDIRAVRIGKSITIPMSEVRRLLEPSE